MSNALEELVRLAEDAPEWDSVMSHRIENSHGKEAEFAMREFYTAARQHAKGLVERVRGLEECASDPAAAARKWLDRCVEKEQQNARLLEENERLREENQRLSHAVNAMHKRLRSGEEKEDG